MKDFLYLIKRKDCCIHYRKLEEYGILKFDSSNKFKRIMNENDFTKSFIIPLNFFNLYNF